jgi:hypothetical protein
MGDGLIQKQDDLLAPKNKSKIKIVDTRTKKEFCISSKCDNDNHILIWDFDSIEQHFVFRSLSQIQNHHGLSDIYIIKSLHGFNAICLDKLFLNHVYNILFYTRWNDFNHVRVGYKHESWCLKCSPHKKMIMRLIPTDTYDGSRKQSIGHYKFFEKYFKFDGFRIINPDDNDDIQLESYNQNRC